MKRYIKNVTDSKEVIPELGRRYRPRTLTFKEDGKLIEIKPGELIETKLNGENVSGRRLRLVTEDEVKKKKEKKEVKK